MKRILIQFEGFSLPANLNDSPTSQALIQVLPIDCQVNTWGEEIYFEIPVDMPQEPGAREIVSVGTLGYWPLGKAFCIFFGPTPISNDQRPRAYSPVNIIGDILGDCKNLLSVQNKDKVTLKIADQD